MRRSFFALAVFAVLFLQPLTPAQPLQTTCDPSGTGCSQTTLRSAIADARTVAVQAPPRDRFAEAELARFVKNMGKQLAAPHGAADVTLVLSAPEATGVDIGPADRELATLRVYSGRNGQLIWVERVTGHPDKPWPSVVGEVLDQFKATLGQPSR